eukprot:9005803-Alexandrium_andersonii.AAC.1
MKACRGAWNELVVMVGSRVHQSGNGGGSGAPRVGFSQGSAGIVGVRSGGQAYLGHRVRLP